MNWISRRGLVAGEENAESFEERMMIYRGVLWIPGKYKKARPAPGCPAYYNAGLMMLMILPNCLMWLQLYGPALTLPTHCELRFYRPASSCFDSDEQYFSPWVWLYFFKWPGRGGCGARADTKPIRLASSTHSQVTTDIIPKRAINADFLLLLIHAFNGVR